MDRIVKSSRSHIVEKFPDPGLQTLRCFSEL
jgi:hypothetical protein